MTQEELLDDLRLRVKQDMAELSGMMSLSEGALNFKIDPDKWSVLECIEHLNRYGRFYLPEITERMEAGKHYGKGDIIKSTWLGNYFAKAVAPKEQLNVMKTFTNMNPAGSYLTPETLVEFKGQLERTLELLDIAEERNMSKIKTSISISKWIRLRLCDTFRVMIYHNQRHVIQAQNMVKVLPKEEFSDQPLTN